MKNYFLILCLFTLTAIHAQENRRITGLVQDSLDKYGLPGASVIVETQSVSTQSEYTGLVESTSIGTLTDIDGNFTLEIPNDTKAVRISYVGYESKLIPLTAKTHYTVYLGEENNILNEVIITGYQAIEKRKLTSSVAQISMSDIEQTGVATVDQMLMGQIAGMAVSSPTGAPGAPAKIRIRGTASLNGPQDPLWVLDGMPLEGNDVPDFSSKDNIDQLQNFAIAGLNPDDILDITILKDASATAIYGARAANGVIVVTTKKGKKGEMKVNFNANTFFNEKPQFSKLNLMNSSEKVDFELMLAGRSDLNFYGTSHGQVMRILQQNGDLNNLRNNGFSGLTPESQNQINQLRKNNTQWGDLLYRSTVNQQYGLSLSGGSDKSDYYFSLGYYDEQGSTVGTGFNRYNITLKNNYYLTDKVKVGAAIFAAQTTTENFVSDADASINPNNYSRNVNPYMIPYNSDGSYFYDQDIEGKDGRYIPFNFLEERNNTDYELINKSIKAVFDIQYSVNDDLKLTSQFGIQLEKGDTEKYTGKDSYATRKFREGTRYYDSSSKEYKFFLPVGGIIENFNNDIFQYNWKTQLTYNTIINDIHEIDVMGGMELREAKNTIIKTKGFGYNPKTLTTTQIIFPTGSTAGNDKIYETYKKTLNEDAYASFFATAAYTFDRRYTVFGSIRYDGSNLFGVDPQYRYLPLWAISGSWLVSNEKFMEHVNFVDNLRIRASYGLQGNIDRTTSPFVVGEYSTSSILPGYPEETIQVTMPPNGTLRWEKTTNTNLGFDLSVLKNRVMVEMDVYDRKSTDLIGIRALPAETGFEFTNMNWAQVTNKGYEISLTTKNISTPDFSWTTTFNFAKNKSTVDKIQVGDNDYTPSREGKAVNSLFVIKTAGIDDQGNLLFWREGQKVTGVEFFGLYDMIPGLGIAASNLSAQEQRDLFTYAGDKDPKFTGGIINTLRLKNWDLTVSAAFNIKQMVLESPTYNNGAVNPGKNYSRDLANIWSPQNPTGTLPGILSNDPYDGTQNSLLAQWFDGGDPAQSYKYLDIWAKEISYLRINSIRLGYTLPQSVLNKLRLSNAKFTVEGRNLFVIGTNYDGYFDPETYGNIYAQPIQKSVSLGLNVTF